MPLVLREAHLDAIFTHAIADAPDECCGILLGRTVGDSLRVAEVHPVANVWEGVRTRRFMLDPKTHLRLQREGRERGLDIIGFYHSHPTGRPHPSAFDDKLAWPDHAYLIVSLRDGKPGEARTWRLDETTRRLVADNLEIESSRDPEQGIRSR